MLLELLNHHEDLFLAVISARKSADLAVLGATCRQLNSIINALVIYKHYKLFHASLKIIKTINILINDRTTLREFNNNLHVYVYHYPVYESYKARIWYAIFSTNNIEFSIEEIVCKTSIRTKYNTFRRFDMSVEPVPNWLSKYIDAKLVRLVSDPLISRTFVDLYNS